MSDVEILRTGGAGGKRVAAPRPPPPPPPPPPGTPCWLQARECSGSASGQHDLHSASFSHFQLKREMDLFRLRGHDAVWPPVYLRRRSPVREVLAAEGLVLALAESGVCTAHDQESGAPLGYLNVQADELICSLFVCPLSRSLLTVSTFTGDEQQRLHVRATPLAAIARGQLRWRHLFESEVLRHPGFIEFDDVNRVVLTRSADSSAFKVWDLRAPLHPLFSLSVRGVREVKIAAGGALLLIMEPEADPRPGSSLGACCLPLRVLDLQDGSLVQEVRLPVPSSAAGSASGNLPFELVDLFGGCLLTKAAGGPLQIRDLAAGSLREVPAGCFAEPAATLFMQFNSSFLAFPAGADAQLWSLPGGERLATLEGARLPASPYGIYVSECQRLMFLYSAPPEAASGGGGGGEHGPAAAHDVALSQRLAAEAGSVKVFDLLRGRQVAQVAAPPLLPCLPSSGRRGDGPGAFQALFGALALKHVTALFYDERTHRLYTGGADGQVRAWGL